MMYANIVVSLVIFLAAVLSDGENLVSHLLNNYEGRGKAIGATRPSFNVTFSMDILHLLQVNEPLQEVVLAIGGHEIWHDKDLYWNPEDWGGVRKVTIWWEEIWKPDTVLYNNHLIEDVVIRRIDTVVLHHDPVLNTTRAEMMYYAVVPFTCDIDATMVPFDDQICSLTFGSWSQSSEFLNYTLVKEKIFHEDFVDDPLWKFAGYVYMKHYDFGKPFSLVRYDIYLRRRPLFYLTNIIFPTTVISFVSIVGFITPSASDGARGEKMSLAMNTLLALAVLLVIMSENLQQTGIVIPITTWFLLTIILIVTFAAATDAFVLWIEIHGYRGNRLPRWVVVFMRALNCLLAGVCAGRDHPFDFSDTENNDENSPRLRHHEMVRRISSRRRAARDMVKLECNWAASVVERFAFFVAMSMLILVNVWFASMAFVERNPLMPPF